MDAKQLAEKVKTVISGHHFVAISGADNVGKTTLVENLGLPTFPSMSPQLKNDLLSIVGVDMSQESYASLERLYYSYMKVQKDIAIYKAKSYLNVCHHPQVVADRFNLDAVMYIQAMLRKFSHHGFDPPVYNPLYNDWVHLVKEDAIILLYGKPFEGTNDAVDSDDVIQHFVRNYNTYMYRISPIYRIHNGNG